MSSEINLITLALPYHLGRVNCYLIKLDTGYVLIDTGSSNQRRVLEAELHNAGCQPGDLKLIILTHGDFDHTGNAAYLHQKFGAPLAMHPNDFGMIEQGDMFASRGKRNPIFKVIAPLLFKFDQADRITPDIKILEDDDLSAYGFNAKVLSIPGHSTGSIGILTPHGDLFVGDLLENTKQPALNSIMDDHAAAQASLARLKGLPVQMVYPGHGQPFPLEHYVEYDRQH